MDFGDLDLDFVEAETYLFSFFFKNELEILEKEFVILDSSKDSSNCFDVFGTCESWIEWSKTFFLLSVFCESEDNDGFSIDFFRLIGESVFVFLKFSCDF